MTGATAPPPAKFYSRTAAFLIDIITLILIWSTVGLVMLSGSLVMLAGHLADLGLASALTALGIALGILWFIPTYFIIFHAFGGATPGKCIMGIRVVSSDNKVIRPGIAFLRVIGYLLSGLPMASGFLWILLDRKREAWHDKLAGTRVIYG